MQYMYLSGYCTIGAWYVYVPCGRGRRPGYYTVAAGYCTKNGTHAAMSHEPAAEAKGRCRVLPADWLLYSAACVSCQYRTAG